LHFQLCEQPCRSLGTGRAGTTVAEARELNKQALAVPLLAIEIDQSVRRPHLLAAVRLPPPHLEIQSFGFREIVEMLLEQVGEPLRARRRRCL
jgi:hypothetical protein